MSTFLRFIVAPFSCAFVQTLDFGRLFLRPTYLPELLFCSNRSSLAKKGSGGVCRTFPRFHHLSVGGVQELHERRVAVRSRQLGRRRPSRRRKRLATREGRRQKGGGKVDMASLHGIRHGHVLVKQQQLATISLGNLPMRCL